MLKKKNSNKMLKWILVASVLFINSLSDQNPALDPILQNEWDSLQEVMTRMAKPERSSTTTTTSTTSTTTTTEDLPEPTPSFEQMTETTIITTPTKTSMEEKGVDSTTVIRTKSSNGQRRVKPTTVLGEEKVTVTVDAGSIYHHAPPSGTTAPPSTSLKRQVMEEVISLLGKQCGLDWHSCKNFLADLEVLVRGSGSTDRIAFPTSLDVMNFWLMVSSCLLGVLILVIVLVAMVTCPSTFAGFCDRGAVLGRRICGPLEACRRCLSRGEYDVQIQPVEEASEMDEVAAGGELVNLQDIRRQVTEVWGRFLRGEMDRSSGSGPGVSWIGQGQRSGSCRDHSDIIRSRSTLDLRFLPVSCILLLVVDRRGGGVFI